MPPRNLENLLTATAAGKIIGVGRQRIHQYRRDGRLKSLLVGGIHFFRERDVLAVKGKLKPEGWQKGRPRPPKGASK